MSLISEKPKQPLNQNASVAIAALSLFVLAMLIRGLLLWYRLNMEHTELIYLGGSDIPGWMGMARHLAGGGDLSYWLMGARPPLYPAMAAVVMRLGGDLGAVALVQITVGSLTVVFGYLIVYRLFKAAAGIPYPDRLAGIAGVIMALDPAHVSSSATLMSEPLFAFLLTAFLYYLTCYIQEQRWHDLALSSLLMAAAMLTRPTAIYLWLAAPLIFIPLLRQWWKPALALAVVGLAVYMGWSARNLHYHGVFTYSLQTNFQILFYRAVSAEHLATGREAAEVRIDYVRHLYRHVGQPADSAASDAFWAFLVAEDPEIYAEMGRYGVSRLVRYWPYAVLGTGVGLFRIFAITDSLPVWIRPIELLYHALLYGLTLWGSWRAFRARHWQLLLIALVPILYITGLTVIAQTSSIDTRMRTNIIAPLAVLAVYGGCDLWHGKRMQRLFHMKKQREHAAN